MTDLHVPGILSALRWINSGLGNIQTAAALREHIALYKTKLEFITEQVVELEKELAAKVEEAQQYKEELARYKISAEYAEESGALFKRLPSGGYGDCPICPVCHSAMSSFGGPMAFECGNPKCGMKAGFGKRDLAKIMARLPKADQEGQAGP